VARQLQRYFVALMGFGVAAVWSSSGFNSGLACLLAAAVCYAATAFHQRRAEPHGARRPRRATRADSVPRRPQRPSVVPVVLEEREEVAGDTPARVLEYGW
jgi:hypothetical protein